MSFHSTFVLITGATRGIGRAIAFRLASNGYSLLLTSRNEADLIALKTALTAFVSSLQVEVLAKDLSNPNEVDELASWALTFQPEILINNAAVFRPVTFLDQDVEDQQKQWQLNFLASQTLSKALGNFMKKRQKGHIVMIGSTASRETVAAATYTVTKYALHGLTLVLRDELRPHEVRVTEIVAGSTYTSSWEGTSLLKSLFMAAEDVADAVLFALQSPRSAMVEEIVLRPQKGNVSSF